MSADEPRFYLSSWTSVAATFELRPGHLFAYKNQPYRLLRIGEKPLADWDQDVLDEWDAAGRPDPATWRRRPMAMVFRHDTDPDGHGQLRGEANADHPWIRLPEHYVACVRCGELPPCRETRIAEQVAKAGKRMEWALALTSSSCHGCGEPVTTRQHAIRFDGGNLIRPDLGEGSALFHLRRACFSAAYAYDEAWVAALPGRSRRLECAGRIVRHRDRTSECDAAACPGPEARHENTVIHDPRHLPWNPGMACWCLGGTEAHPKPAPEVPGQLGLFPKRTKKHAPSDR